MPGPASSDKCLLHETTHFPDGRDGYQHSVGQARGVSFSREGCLPEKLSFAFLALSLELCHLRAFKEYSFFSLFPVGLFDRDQPALILLSVWSVALVDPAN